MATGITYPLVQTRRGLSDTDERISRVHRQTSANTGSELVGVRGAFINHCEDFPCLVQRSPKQLVLARRAREQNDFDVDVFGALASLLSLRSCDSAPMVATDGKGDTDLLERLSGPVIWNELHSMVNVATDRYSSLDHENTPPAIWKA